jgi:transposase InsO family protein
MGCHSERDVRSEAVRMILVPLRLDAMRHELGYYATWFNEHRPHTALGGRTPHEVYRGLPSRDEVPRLEPRASW